VSCRAGVCQCDQLADERTVDGRQTCSCGTSTQRRRARDHDVYRYSRNVLLGVNAQWFIGRSGRFTESELVEPPAAVQRARVHVHVRNLEVDWTEWAAVAYATAAFVFCGTMSALPPASFERLFHLCQWGRLLRLAMDDNSQTHWYLVRTKTVRSDGCAISFAHVVPEVFCPMLKAKAPRWGREAVSIGSAVSLLCVRQVRSSEPVFRCEVHGRCARDRVGWKRSAGGAGGDSLGHSQPRRERRDRNTGQPLGIGERVVVVDGPFRGFEAIFQRYLAGAERVAILLSAVESGGLRVVLSASAVIKDS